MGDMTKTMVTLIIGNPGVKIKYMHRENDKEYIFDTEKLEANGDISSVNVVELIKLIKQSLQN